MLPTPVDPAEAEEMFNFADKDRDGRISWDEFQIMINPPPPPKPPTPHKEMLISTFSFPNGDLTKSTPIDAPVLQPTKVEEKKEQKQ